VKAKVPFFLSVPQTKIRAQTGKGSLIRLANKRYSFPNQRTYMYYKSMCIILIQACAWNLNILSHAIPKKSL